MNPCSNCEGVAAYGQTFCSTSCEVEHDVRRAIFHKGADGDTETPQTGRDTFEDACRKASGVKYPGLVFVHAGEKPTNPKDIIGSNKLPLHLWPETATAVGCLAFLEGALKYGRGNFRAIGVRASIYFDAARRHLNAWFEGEDIDPESGLPHLGKALACLAIIVDAEAKGVLTDDRQYPGGYKTLVDRLTPHVAELKARHADKKPKHYLRADAAPAGEGSSES